MAVRHLVAGLFVAALLPSSLAQGFALCQKDGKPAPIQNVRIARNEMLDDKMAGETRSRSPDRASHCVLRG
jgi:hypothetical protein